MTGDEYQPLSTVSDGTATERLEPPGPEALSEPDPRYAAAWTYLRAAKWVHLGGCIVAVPGAVAINAVGGKGLSIVWVAAAILAFALGGIAVQLVPCPRCRKPFVGMRGSTFRSSCRSCGLPIDAERDPEPERAIGTAPGPEHARANDAAAREVRRVAHAVAKRTVPRVRWVVAVLSGLGVAWLFDAVGLSVGTGAALSLALAITVGVVAGRLVAK